MDLAQRQNAVDEASGLRDTGEMSGAFFSSGLTGYRFAAPQKLSRPVLVLAGTEDQAIGLPSQRALTSALPRAKLVEFERAGHFLYLDVPGAIHPHCDRVLKRPSALSVPLSISRRLNKGGRRGYPSPRAHWFMTA